MNLSETNILEIDGKLFKFHTVKRTKKEAQTTANNIRKTKNRYVRVIQDRQTRWWDVFVGPKKL